MREVGAVPMIASAQIIAGIIIILTLSLLVDHFFGGSQSATTPTEEWPDGGYGEDMS